MVSICLIYPVLTKATKNQDNEHHKMERIVHFTKNGSDESCSMTASDSSTSNNQSSSNNLLRKFSCDGYQDITVENVSTDKVKVADGYGGIHTLNSASSGSGERYSNGNISIHMKGNEAVYTENGKDKSCSLQNSGHGSIEE